MIFKVVSEQITVFGESQHVSVKGSSKVKACCCAELVETKWAVQLEAGRCMDPCYRVGPYQD